MPLNMRRLRAVATASTQGFVPISDGGEGGVKAGGEGNAAIQRDVQVVISATRMSTRITSMLKYAA